MSHGLGGPSRRIDDTTYEAWAASQRASASSLQPMVDPYKAGESGKRTWIPQTAPHDLPHHLRSLCCDPDVYGVPDHGHTSCYYMWLAAEEIERMRMVLGDLTKAKQNAVSRGSHARYKATRRLRLVQELRDQNARLIAELLAYRAEHDPPFTCEDDERAQRHRVSLLAKLSKRTPSAGGESNT